MKTIVKRKVSVKWELWRGAVSLQSLQMMVMSGVVRRADLDPPQDPGRTGYWHSGKNRVNIPQESASEQGWISRMLLGRKSHIQSAQKL
ncbi:MAG: hypothetical protein ABL965_07710 [Nitrospira sp.]|nr:MAG: hypothetical protein CAF44_007935 [Nitrospira sp. CG24D]TKB82911.1 MAG: hypothetical protein E8D44_10465 [Nitrospira sp.]